jgi:hypothetical protein
MRRVPADAVLVAMLFIVSMLTGSRAYGQEPSFETSTLKGLSGVQVVIEDLTVARPLLSILLVEG